MFINFNDIVLIFQSFVYIIKQRGDKVNEDKKLNLDIGKRIYERRRQAGITQERLAELADTTPQAISNYERGERELRAKTIIRLAAALNTTADFLLTGKSNSLAGMNVSKLESLYLAYNILLSKRKTEIIRRLNESKEQKNGPCPLYDGDNDFHCMCYDARPLICRLFASSCFPGKNGESKFAFCHLNTDFKGPDKVPADAPVMGVFGQRMICLEDNDNITEFLPLRVLKDISLIEFYSRLKK